MKFDIQEVLVSGDRVVVRGEVTGPRRATCSRAAYGQDLSDYGGMKRMMMGGEKKLSRFNL